MAAPIPLRPDYDGAGLRALARRSKDADQTRRLLALALIYDGGSRRSAAQLGGVGLQIIRDWVLRFNAHGPDCRHWRKKWQAGQPRRLTVWCVGGSRIWRTGSSRNSASRSTRRQWDES